MGCPFVRFLDDGLIGEWVYAIRDDFRNFLRSDECLEIVGSMTRIAV